MLNAQDAEAIRTEIDKILRYDAEWDRTVTPGFILTIIDGTYHESFIYGRGVAESSDPLSTSATFQLGGLGHVFIAKEIITSGIRLNDKVCAQHKEWSKTPIGQLSYDDILSHRAGFKKTPRGLGRIEKDPSQPYKYWTRDIAHSYYRDYPEEKLLQEWKYSHHGYALLADLFQINVDTSRSIIPGYTRNKEITVYKKDWGYLNPVLTRTGTTQDLIGLIQSIWPILPYLESTETEHKNIEHNGLMYRSKHAGKYIVYSHAGQMNGHHIHVSTVADTKTAVILQSIGERGVPELGPLVLRMLNHNWKRPIDE